MQHAPVPSVTSAPVTLSQEQRTRMWQYLATMGLRTACFIGAYFFEGWLRWVCVALAVILPYFAVVIVNAVRPRGVPVEATLAGQRPRRQLESKQ